MEQHPARRGSLSPRFPTGDVALLPIHPIEPAHIEQIAAELRARGIGVTIKRPVLRPRGSCDERRRQFRADVLLDRVIRSSARPIVGMTDADCYVGDMTVGGAAGTCSCQVLRILSAMSLPIGFVDCGL